jgi:hypothetical protein
MLVAAAGAAWVLAGCARGTSVAPGVGGAGGGGAGSGGGGEGWIGSPCETADSCPEGAECVLAGNEKICTRPCPPGCPAGSYCTLIGGDAYCVPDKGSQCTKCLGAVQCAGLNDSCLTAPAGDKFCARDCTVMGDCPSGFVCMSKDDYKALGEPPPMGGGGAGGVGAGGAGGTAGAGGAAGGDEGGAGGGAPAAGTPYKFCVPPDRLSCPCDDKRDGVIKSCDIVNELGHCPGDETCDGEGGEWVGCTAKVPQAETCNDVDDDCNGAVDEGDANALCGGAPPNASYLCEAGACELGPCEPGFTQYPAGAPADGCTCPVDAGEPNDTCATPTSAGSITDTGGPALITGSLSSDDDVDVWTFTAVDVDEGTTNSYHVSVKIAAGPGSDDVLLDVVRGDACSDAPTGPASAITAYDWCVDGKSADGLSGEAPCSATGPVHCNDHSSTYFVRVYRKPGAPASCLFYELEIAAQGGDPCNFDLKCP